MIKRQKVFNKSCYGFSLIELMVILIIIAGVLAGITSGFRLFTEHSSTLTEKNKENAAVKAAIKLLQRDLNMAGFGLPTETRIAASDDYVLARESDFNLSYDCNNDGASNGNITEQCIGYDVDSDGYISTNPIYRERLFIADGWTILEDVTDNQDIDGEIVENPVNYFYKISNKKDTSNGYKTKLSASYPANSIAIALQTLNINSGDEYNASSNDFSEDGALILYGHDTTSTNYWIEGHLISSINTSSNTINFQLNDGLLNTYDENDSIVVPAITWYVSDKDNTLWLYRNEDKVLPNVIGFQIDFGFDIDHDGLQWYPTLPPANNSVIDNMNFLTTDGDIFNSILKSLKAVRIAIVMKDQSDNLLHVYKKIVVLKN